METGIFRPTAIGGTVSAIDSDSLATLESDGMPPGTKVWNADVGNFFELTVSTDALDPDVIVAVAGITGLRWIISDSIENATHADTADVATLADTATVPASATTFTAALNVATPSLKGLLSSADKALLDTLNALDAWERTQALTMLTAIPELTAFWGIKPGSNPLGITAASPAAVTGDANVLGGGITSPDAQLRSYGASVFKDFVSGKGAFAFRGTLKGPTAAHENAFGLSNVGFTADLMVEVFPTSDLTHYVLRWDGATATKEPSTVVANAADHNFVVAWNTVNVRLYIDGTIAATHVVDGNLGDGVPMQLMNYNTTSGDAIAKRIMIGFIQ